MCISADLSEDRAVTVHTIKMPSPKVNALHAECGGNKADNKTHGRLFLMTHGSRKMCFINSLLI